MDSHVQLLALVAALFFLPKSLQRLRIPAPLTEFGLGILLGPLALGLIEPSGLLLSLSGFGISALFLFAGLEVEIGELRARRGPLALHLALQLILVAGAAAAGYALGLEPPVALLVGAAVMSPSVGYIAAALEARPMPQHLARWIMQKAIAGELMAIAMVLVSANTRSPQDLALGLAAVAGLVIAVPLLIWIFHHFILPWAPRTEFPFLLILALLAADLSHRVGVHYLAGAFIVGVVARRYLDGLASRGIAKASVGEALVAFRFFAAFFVPFFFFLVGLLLPEGAFSVEAAILAGALLAVAVPLRIVPTLLHRRVGMRERWREAAGVGLFLVPTTVFTFAVAELLRERFDLAPWVYGGLVAYGAATALAPLLIPGGIVESGSEIVDVAAEELLLRERGGAG